MNCWLISIILQFINMEMMEHDRSCSVCDWLISFNQVLCPHQRKQYFIMLSLPWLTVSALRAISVCGIWQQAAALVQASVWMLKINAVWVSVLDSYTVCYLNHSQEALLRGMYCKWSNDCAINNHRISYPKVFLWTVV